jgi:hypothetical protein
VTKLYLFSPPYPWAIIVDAMQPKVGVTCKDVIEAISANMCHLAESDYKSLKEQRKQDIERNYKLNRTLITENGDPWGWPGEGVRRFDFLGKELVFGGIVNEPEAVRRMVGSMPPGTLVLRCVVQHHGASNKNKT